MFRRWWPLSTSSSVLTPKSDNDNHHRNASSNNDTTNKQCSDEMSGNKEDDHGMVGKLNDGDPINAVDATMKRVYTAADVPDFTMELELDDDTDMF